MASDSIHADIIQLIRNGSMPREPARLSLVTEPALLGMFRDSHAKRSLVPAAVDGFRTCAAPFICPCTFWQLTCRCGVDGSHFVDSVHQLRWCLVVLS